jgi:phosphate transport system substrate-binding protein
VRPSSIRRRAAAATISAALALGAGVALGAPASAAPRSVTVESPPSAATALSESGSSLLYPLWNLWAAAYSKAWPSVTVQTASTGSGQGITDALQGTASIGASDAYLPPGDFSSNKHVENIPLAISSQFVAYNLPELRGNLNLSGSVLSQIYQGKITKWNARAIASLNRGVHLPNTTIVTVHRSEGSGDTFLFSQFLSKTDSKGWGTKIGYNTTVAWPAIPGALGEMGNSGMLSGCMQTVGCIAYVGISYLSKATADGLHEAKLENASGKFVLPVASTILAEANAFTRLTPASGVVSMIDGSAKAGYPIVNYEYAIVVNNQPSAATAQAIRSVLEWAIDPTDGNSSLYLSQVGFQPLPSSVLGQSLTQIKKIQ